MSKSFYSDTYGLVDYKPDNTLIDWIENKIFNKNKYYWFDEGHVNGKIRFMMYCEKTPFRMYVEDIKTKHKIEINYKSSGYKRAENIIKTENASNGVVVDPIPDESRKKSKEEELIEIISKLKTLIKKIKE